jgi:hypothetical protein
MLQHHPIIALDYTRERAREARAAAEADRLVRLVAAAGKPGPRRSGSPVRTLAAAMLRRIGAGAEALASASSRAATRVEA